MNVNKYGLLILLVLISVLVMNCRGPTTYILTRGIGHFSIELPDGYRVSMVENREDHGYTNVSIVGIKREYEEIHAAMGVLILEIDDNYPDPTFALEESLHMYSNWPDFQLIERSLIEVAGIQAEQFIVYVNTFHTPHPSPEEKPIPTKIREIYFKYGNNIWNIIMNTSETSYELDNVDFERILDTFRILD